KARAQGARTLLGKPTQCVGRIRELGMLDVIYDQCVGESAAQAVLLDGAEGAGKSRTLHEFLGKLSKRDPAGEVWTAHGNPMSVGAPFGMVIQALRRGVGLNEGDPVAARRTKLRARIAEHAHGRDIENVATFLCELLGMPEPSESSEKLRAARQDAVVMGDQ